MNLILVEKFEHQKGRYQNLQFNSDRPGRRYGSAMGTKHGLSTQVKPYQQENLKFIQQVVNYLQSQAEKQKFDQLILVAPPKLLGTLRKNLSPTLKNKVIEEHHKEISFKSTPKEVENYLKETLALFEQNPPKKTNLPSKSPTIKFVRKGEVSL